MLGGGDSTADLKGLIYNGGPAVGTIAVRYSPRGNVTGT